MDFPLLVKLYTRQNPPCNSPPPPKKKPQNNKQTKTNKQTVRVWRPNYFFPDLRTPASILIFLVYKQKKSRWFITSMLLSYESCSPDMNEMPPMLSEDHIRAQAVQTVCNECIFLRSMKNLSLWFEQNIAL